MDMAFNFRFKPFSLVCLLIFAFACGYKSNPVSVDEAKQFAEKVEASVLQNDPNFLNNSLDKKEILKRAGLKSKVWDPASSKGYAMDIGTKLMNTLQSKGTYEVVKHYEKSGIRHILFRMFLQGNINYHDFELHKKGSKVLVSDIYVYTTGENLSETLSLINSEMDDIENQPGDREDKDKWLNYIGRLKEMALEGRHEEAKKLFHTIPHDVQQMKIMQLTNLTICSGLGKDEYNEAFKQYESRYPDEKNIPFLKISYYMMNDDSKNTLLAVDELDRFIDKDPLLDYFRHLCHYSAGDRVNSLICLKRLVKNMPDFEDGVMELIALFLKEGDSESARPLIERFRKNASFDQKNLDNFLNTIDYKN
jgi:hypothetical protein